MLIGSASTVTSVSVNNVRLVCSLSFFLQQLDALHQRRQIVEHQRKFFGRLAQFLQVAVADPGRRAVEQPEHRAWLGRQQALQPHQPAPARAAWRRGRPVGLQALREQLVFDAVHADAGLAHDLHQHVGLVAQQVRQHVQRRTEALATAHRGTQLVDRAQRLRPRRDQQAAIGSRPQRGDVVGRDPKL
ncbi:hypothetical protein GCM10027081_26650 [Cupriavidus yeoncheonensis]